MIDIHCHLLYGVDDGAENRQMSVEMLKHAVGQGIRRVIFTPHYRQGMFKYPLDKIMAAYEDVKGEAEKLGMISYLGCEYHADSGTGENFKCGRCLTLADSEYVLVEFKYESSIGFIRNTLYDLFAYGYTPVIAHAERYGVFIKDPGILRELRDMGVSVQINAGSVLGREGFKTKRLCKRIIKDHLVDIVASDSHNMTDRKNHMKECYEYIAKRYGEGRAERLFCTNPGKILEK